MKDTNSKIIVNSLMRGLLVLECFNQERNQLSLAELSSLLDLPKSSLFRIAKTLSEMGYLRYDAGSKKYSLDTRVLSLGFSVLQSMELRELARPYLESLSSRFDKTVNLGILDRHEIVYFERVKVPGYRDFNIGIGSRIPVWNTAIGRAVLAYIKPDDLNHIIEKLDRIADFQLAGGENWLMANLQQVRRDGFAINDRDLFKKWVRAIAVPIFAQEGVVGAINIVVEPDEVSIDELRSSYAPLLVKVSKELSAALG